MLPFQSRRNPRVFDFQLVQRSLQDGVHWGMIRVGDAMLCIYQAMELGISLPFLPTALKLEIDRIGIVKSKPPT